MNNLQLLIAIYGLGLGIPLTCVVYLWYQHQKRWAFLTLASALAGFGWLVGLIGVIFVGLKPIPANVDHTSIKQPHAHM